MDFLTKKHKVNEGEVPQFYVTGNHEAIIPPAEFEMVQAELAGRKAIGRGYSGNSVFASRIVCGDCGGYYGQKVWHSNDRYRKVIWRCNKKYIKGQERCCTPTLDEETIKALFLKAYDLLMADRETVAADCRTLVDMLADSAVLDEKITAAQKEIEDVIALNSAFIHSHRPADDNMEEFKRQTAEYDERYRKTEARLNRMQAERQDRLARGQAVKSFVDALMEQPLILTEWQDHLWNLLVQKMVIHEDGTAEFTFKGENIITVGMD